MRGINSQLAKYNIQFTIEERDNLQKRLIAGDETAIEPTVMGHLKLACEVAGRFINGRNDEELVSVAAMALVQGCHRIINKRYKKLDNLTTFLSYNVQRKCIDFIDADSVISVNRNTNHARRMKNQQPIKIPIVELNPEYHRKKANKLTDLKELIDSVIMCPLEQAIVEMRIQGYADCEIADSLSISPQTIGRIRRELEKRFNKAVVQ